MKSVEKKAENESIFQYRYDGNVLLHPVSVWQYTGLVSSSIGMAVHGSRIQ